ncbi:hypothetical protein AVEN_220915-1 [Araneus ventricosus]|uniref:Uncharacterized protein n=1 Tax=Araneus ventricosus TaxID=182803 RepID=A0A4Y2UXY9_ARAVE|nr:hypothetical protein AVEN_220915-1 [Araneus ventricosus]
MTLLFVRARDAIIAAGPVRLVAEQTLTCWRQCFLRAYVPITGAVAVRLCATTVFCWVPHMCRGCERCIFTQSYGVMYCRRARLYVGSSPCAVFGCWLAVAAHVVCGMWQWLWRRVCQTVKLMALNA